MRACVPFILILAGSLTASSQSAPPASPPESVPALKVDVRLVPVHAVVRDSQGRAVGNLSKEDFQLFENGKPQVITQFSVEHTGGPGAKTSTQPGETAAAVAPQARFTAYLFDDLHLQRNDLVEARKAAERQLASLSPATERAAIFTTSGLNWEDFTADQAKLHDTLIHLEPRGRPVASNCPNMNYYMADLIANRGDQDALQVAASEALACGFDGNKKLFKAARQMAGSVAREKSEIGRVETGSALAKLKALVQVMSRAPGQRTVIVVSPGFFIGESPAQAEIMDMAVRGEVMVSALDPRGLMPATDISAPGGGRFNLQNFAYKTLSDTEEQAVLEELADGTGGVFFHNNNDVDEGFRRAAATPEYSYVLAFSPQDLKFDGRFHKLKVTVNNGSNLTVQARKGYYAPKKKP